MTVVTTARAAINGVLGSKERPGGAVMRDMGLLVPAFRVRVEAVLDGMRADGFAPMVWETLRSPERCEELHRRGTGKVMSVHRLGVAADIIDSKLRWSATPAFWRSLRRHADLQGLTSGAAWARHDLPHVQALPAAWDRRLFGMTPEEVASAVRAQLPLAPGEGIV